MIYGIFHRDKNRNVNKEGLFQLLPENLASKPTNTFLKGNVGFGTSDIGVPTVDDGTGFSYSSNKKIVVAASGNIFASEFDTSTNELTNVSQVILSAYQKNGENCFKNLNGQFTAAIWDSPQQKFILGIDHLGFEPLFYFWDEKSLIFCSFLKTVLQHNDVDKSINFRAIRNYLLFNYNPGLDTFIKNVNKVRPGTCLVFEKDKLTTKRYWFLSYQKQNGRKIDDYTEELLSLTKDAIKIRTQESSSDPGAFLSGGMDSSSVVGLLSGLTDRPLHTFSFRCEGKDVDESYFARVMANHYKTKHHEIEYSARQLQHLDDMTKAMVEPLCDIGVELGSFVMGRAAQGNVKYILTGDGGDELYAGHPVYVADRIAERFDKIPAPIRYGITKTAALLPDSDKKKSLLIKTRRFAYSYDFPPELLSNRWRIYYNDDELKELCNQEVVSGFGKLNSYDDIISLYDDADGPDLLSRSLYGDYQTLVRFHIDRLRLTRASGIEARFPLHDYRLIEFSATIPSHLKIKDSKVKYIQHKAMEGVLPDEIVFRKDKMGHNVPMKNWMRHTTTFRELINDVLSESAIKKRNYFDSQKIQTMLDLHLKKKKDYSHRLYSLLILELWFRNHLD